MSVQNIVNINESNLQQTLEQSHDHAGTVLFLV
ncbi:Thioredoxin domain-containing protein EC-YbbN [Salmonella enterica subsp. enterica]|uniref:Thioredoxin domain-containing protein EC-YbbN n=1 Tax=Salmonella enterica I TaxID=59201 RepID=A0A379X073_SALET|nr:Thioredoxin domain-containing protein EC-YbbN [Salmonella enterica subsp. enterica]